MYGFNLPPSKKKASKSPMRPKKNDLVHSPMETHSLNPQLDQEELTH